MNSKLSPIIIGVLVLVAIAIGIYIFSLVTDKPEPGTSNNQIDTVEAIKPVITVSKNEMEDNPTKVTITAKASTEDEGGIETITLPDGSLINYDTATFDITENGTYEFKTRAANGEEASVSIAVTEIVENSADKPYVPEGFHVIHDNVEEGFVIEDESGNQYVWVPEKSGRLERSNATKVNYEDSNSTASALVNSVAKYYGFYMGRFEATQYEKNGEIAAATMLGKVPWTNINYLDAIDYANKSAEAFGYTDCYTSIINSYAFDTTLKWINTEHENYSSSTSFGNYSGTIYPTGTTEQDQVKHICDLAGNVREWTTEIYKEVTEESLKNKKDEDSKLVQRIVRSGGATLRKTPASRGGYPENSVDPYWGFRLILYK